MDCTNIITQLEIIQNDLSKVQISSDQVIAQCPDIKKYDNARIGGYNALGNLIKSLKVNCLSEANCSTTVSSALDCETIYQKLLLVAGSLKALGSIINNTPMPYNDAVNRVSDLINITQNNCGKPKTTAVPNPVTNPIANPATRIMDGTIRVRHNNGYYTTYTYRNGVVVRTVNG